MAVDRPGRSPNRPEPKRDRREISRNRLPTQTPQAGRQDRSAASCDDRRRRNPVVRPSIHPKPSKVRESEIRENHQVFRRVHVIDARGGSLTVMGYTATYDLNGKMTSFKPYRLSLWTKVRRSVSGTALPTSSFAFLSFFGFES